MSLFRMLAIMLVVLAIPMIATGCGDDDATDTSTSAASDESMEAAPEPDTDGTDDGTGTDEGEGDDDGTGIDEGSGGGDPEGSTLLASVGPGFEISLMDMEENPVTELAAGTYTIEVEDLSSAHNFHLTGSGVEETTTVEGEGSETWVVDLNPGEYTYVCDPHVSNMSGSFTVV